jgi:hypothetical protein
MIVSNQYIILNISETGSIDFSLVKETSVETLRFNNNTSKTFIKYEGSAPSFIDSLTTKEGPYSHSEMLNILTGSEWVSNQI